MSFCERRIAFLFPHSSGGNRSCGTELEEKRCLNSARGRCSFLICTQASKQALRRHTRISLAAFVLYGQLTRNKGDFVVQADPYRAGFPQKYRLFVRAYQGASYRYGESSAGLQRIWLIV
jgi:hypothetical protein